MQRQLRRRRRCCGILLPQELNGWQTKIRYSVLRALFCCPIWSFNFLEWPRALEQPEAPTNNNWWLLDSFIRSIGSPLPSAAHDTTTPPPPPGSRGILIKWKEDRQWTMLGSPLVPVKCISPMKLLPKTAVNEEQQPWKTVAMEHPSIFNNQKLLYSLQLDVLRRKLFVREQLCFEHKNRAPQFFRILERDVNYIVCLTEVWIS